MFCGDQIGKEIQKTGETCMHTADSLCCAAKTNITLYSNYTPVKTNKRQNQSLTDIKRGKACLQ